MTTITLPTIEHAELLDTAQAHEAGRAYIDFDPQTSLVSVGTLHQSENGVPMDVWHGRVLRWGIARNVSGEAVTDALEALRPQLKRIAAGHEVSWDGSNHVGRLTDDARDASHEIEAALDELEADLDVQDAWDWVDGGNPGPTLDDVRVRGVEAAAAEIVAEAESQGVYLAGDVEAEIQALLERQDADA